MKTDFNGKIIRILGKIFPVVLACVAAAVFAACGAQNGPEPAGIAPAAASAETAAAAPAKTTEVSTPSLTPGIIRASNAGATSDSESSEFESEEFGLPNIYFFILDEYSSFDMMKKYYDYDNKELDDFLNDKGFNVIRESYSTDNQTEHSICDTLNLSYISRHYSDSKCYKAIANAKLYKALSDLGYTQLQYSTSTKPFKSIVSLDSRAGRKAFESIIIEKSKNNNSGGIVPAETSALLNGEPAGAELKGSSATLTKWGFYTSQYIRSTKEYKRAAQRGHADKILSIFDYFEDPYNYPVTKPRVIYCYMTAAHVPFTFDQYGGIIRSSDSRNWRDKDVYLNQYKFISKHLMATVSTIIANDPDSIIIIMSDHGIRYHADCAKKMKFVITDKDSLRIMNAVYIKGRKYDDMQGLSAINTLRYILRLYGLDYPPIKDPVNSGSPDCLRGIIPRSRHR